jgi:hypothetical protein
MERLPLLARRGGRDTKKMSHSSSYGADGVVVLVRVILHAEFEPPPRLRR